jgi:DNA-binding CsgD family transcriptional regulator/tetratricopeptide (TPR) repeat protein
MASPTEARVFGREDVVSSVTAAISQPATSAVFIYGPSGIGKTRVAADVMARLETNGWAVSQIAGTIGLAAVPLAALSPLFAGDPPDMDAITRNPFALLEYAADRVATVASNRRTLFLVDDISLVDPLSLSVLVHLLQARSVKLVATVRDGDPLPDSLLALWTGESAVRIDVAPLSLDESGAFLVAQLGGQVAQRTTVALHDASEGNPLFLRELALGGIASDQLVLREGSWQLLADPTATPVLRELILSRLRGLDLAGMDVIERIALCQPLPVRELVAPGARGILAALETAGLVLVGGPDDRLVASLPHPQYVAAVRGTIPRLRTADLLLEQAAIVEAASPESGPTPDDAVRIAIWRLGAGHPTNPELLATGARLTRLANDFPETVRLAQAAVKAGTTDPSIHLLLGEALRTLGRTDDALEALDQIDTLDASGSDELAVGIATLHALTRADQPMGFTAGLDELESASKLFPANGAQIGMTRSALLLYLERADLALAELENWRVGNDAPEFSRAAFAVASALPLAAVGRSQEAADAAELALSHAESAGPLAIISLRTGLFISSSVSVNGGNPRLGRDRAMRALHEAIADDDEVSTRHAEFTLGHCYSELGQLRTSARWFRDALSGAIAHGPLSFAGPAAGALAQVLVWRGEFDEARVLLDGLEPDFADWNVSAVLARAWLETVAGDQDRAASRLFASIDRCKVGEYAYLESWLLFNAARLGLPRETVPRLTELADRSDGPLLGLRRDHAAALVAKTPDAAASVAHAWESSGFLLYAAEAFAAASRIATAVGDPRSAAAYARRATERAAQCEGAATLGLVITAATDVLTTREREMASMAAMGLSSQTIASQLFLSVRTVDNHLQSVYRKLGVAGRSDLSSAL